MSCLCGQTEGDGDWAQFLEDLPGTSSLRGALRTYYWSPNANVLTPANLPTRSFGFSFRRRWRELEGYPADDDMIQIGDAAGGRWGFIASPGSSVPPELFSCYLEATAGRSAQFDASSYSSGTLSSGVSSWRGHTARSRSSSSSRGSFGRPRSPSLERGALRDSGVMSLLRFRSSSRDRRSREDGQRLEIWRHRSPSCDARSFVVTRRSGHRRQRSPSHDRWSRRDCDEPCIYRRRSPSASSRINVPHKPPRRTRHRSVDSSIMIPGGGRLALPPPSPLVIPTHANSLPVSACVTPSRASRASVRSRIRQAEGVARAHSMGRLSTGASTEQHPRPPVRRRRGLTGLKNVQ